MTENSKEQPIAVIGIMMPCQQGPGQVVKLAMTGFTPIPLACRFGGMATWRGEGGDPTVRATAPSGPRNGQRVS